MHSGRSMVPLARADLIMQFDFVFSVSSHVALRKNVSTIRRKLVFHMHVLPCFTSTIHTESCQRNSPRASKSLLAFWALYKYQRMAFPLSPPFKRFIRDFSPRSLLSSTSQLCHSPLLAAAYIAHTVFIDTNKLETSERAPLKTTLSK
jgi:hypothetical protein